MDELTLANGLWIRCEADHHFGCDDPACRDPKHRTFCEQPVTHVTEWQYKDGSMGLHHVCERHAKEQPLPFWAKRGEDCDWDTHVKVSSIEEFKFEVELDTPMGCYTLIRVGANYR
jgi:hypothetical protein